jgi:hypothetical protein
MLIGVASESTGGDAAFDTVCPKDSTALRQNHVGRILPRRICLSNKKLFKQQGALVLPYDRFIGFKRNR